jgi:hypothetical protein
MPIYTSSATVSWVHRQGRVALSSQSTGSCKHSCVAEDDARLAFVLLALVVMPWTAAAAAAAACLRSVLHIHVGLYAVHLERWLSHFRPDQLMIWVSRLW